MRYPSTRSRQFRKRLVYSLESLLATAAGVALAAYFLADQVNVDFAKLTVALAVLYPLVASAWLALFASADGEAIVIDDAGLHVESYGLHTSIPWSELTRIKGPKGLRREVKFEGSSGSAVRVSTLAFTSDQWSSVMRAVALRAPHAV